MSRIALLVLLVLCTVSCKDTEEVSSTNPENWKKRAVASIPSAASIEGSSYLSVYSQIYSLSEHRTHDLTVTISMRNMSKEDSIYIHHAEYYNTHGELIRSYFEEPIYLSPLETVEIVIDEKDKEGGTGANFIFDWASTSEENEPFFEAVMISTAGQQGLSFTTEGKRIN